MTAAARRVTIALLTLTALAVFLGFGHRSWHHWDEPVYLFAAARYTPAALAAGVFEPGDFGGFFAAKIGHVALLRWLMTVFGRDVSAIPWMAVVYTLLVIATAAMVMTVHKRFWHDPARAFAAALTALLTPVMVYLGPKLLSEVPAMCAAMGSLLCFAWGVRCSKQGAFIAFMVVSAVCFTMALASRGTTLLLVGGCWAALWIAPPPGLRRGRIVTAALMISALTCLLLVLSQPLFGVNLLRAISSVQGAVVERESWRDGVKRAIFALGPALALVPVALFSHRRREALFSMVWFFCSVGPLLVGLHRLEERFLVTGVPALAGLAVLGGEVLWRWCGSPRHWAARSTVAMSVVALFGVSNYYIQPRTLWEIDTQAYAEAMSWITSTESQRPILAPWGIGDFHYLQFAYPDVPVYLADTEAFCRFITPSGQAPNTADCVARIHRWYGTRWVGDAAALAHLGTPPWLYMTQKALGRDARDRSWVWADPRLRLVPVYRNARYRVYEVEQRL